MKKFRSVIVVVLSVVFCCANLLAYPEMIRQGYAHCAACHFNPAGGGVLTPYGRSISGELLSRWTAPGEERILHGAISKNASSYVDGGKPLSAILGGDVREIQVFSQKANSKKRNKWFLMQADAEGGVRWEKLIVLTTFGQEKHGDEERWHFRKTAVIASVNEGVTVKVGRAQPNLGLMIPEHIASTRSDSGLFPLEEKDLVEIQGNFEKFGVVIGGEQSPYELRGDATAERGFYAQGDLIFKDTYKAGIHYWHRQAASFERNRVGVFSMLGFTKKWALLTDTQTQNEVIKGSSSHWGLFATAKLNYEVTKGVWLAMWGDYSRRVLNDPSSIRERVGPGIQLFPRPHFEIEAMWLKDHSHKDQGDWGDYANLILHYYL